MAINRYDVLIPGNYFCDIIFTGIPEFPKLGAEIFTDDLTVIPGGLMNTVTALRRLNVRVGWVGALGNDFFSRFVSQTLLEENVDTTLITQLNEPFRRVTVSLSYPDDRAFVSYVDPVPDMVQRVFDLLDTIEFPHLHYTGLMLDERMPELMDACHERDITVSMDCQYRKETLSDSIVQAVVSRLDLFTPNHSEALSLTQQPSIQAAADTLQELVPYLVIKDGANGAHAWRNGDHHFAPAMPHIIPKDTTGAGDAFNAGFLAAYLADQPPLTCLQWGNICGGLSTQGYGGYTTAPTLPELQHYLPK